MKFTSVPGRNNMVNAVVFGEDFLKKEFLTERLPDGRVMLSGLVSLGKVPFLLDDIKHKS